MRHFLELARDPRLIRLVDQVHGSPWAQGVVIDFDPFWLALSRLQSMGFEERYLDEILLPRLLNQAASLPGLRRSGVANDILLPRAWRDVLAEHDTTERGDVDLTWRPRSWREFGEVTGRPDTDPRRVVISARPIPAGLRVELEASFASTGRATGLDVVTEIRPVPMLGSSHGTSITGGQRIYAAGADGIATGTLGGLLVDSGSGRAFGITCGHVSAAGDEIYGKPSLASGSRLGRCAVSITAPVTVAGGCNPFRRQGTSGRADLAVIELDGNPPGITRLRRAGRVARVAAPSDVSQDQTAHVAATGGQSTVRLGGLCAYYELRDRNGAAYCYHDLLELKPHPRWFAPFGLSRMPGSGDSGAWVHIAGPEGPEALAIFVASESGAGFACYLDFAIKELAQGGLNLTVA